MTICESSESSYSSDDDCQGLRALRPDLFEKKVVKLSAAEVKAAAELKSDADDKKGSSGLIDPNKLLGSDTVELKVLQSHRELLKEREQQKKEYNSEREKYDKSKVESVQEKQFQLPQIEAHIPLTMFEVETEDAKRAEQKHEVDTKRENEKKRRLEESTKLRERRKRIKGQSSQQRLDR